jgi:hypothetical protein
MKKSVLKSAFIGSIGTVALALSSLGASADSLTFQNVTFTFTEVTPTVLQLEITNALNATGNWAGVKYLEAFNVKPASGSDPGFGASLVSPGITTGWTEQNGGLSNGSSIGCNGSGAGEVCFFSSAVNPPNPPAPPAAPFSLTNDMKFDIAFTGTNIGLLPTAHLKVDFWTSVDPNSPDFNCKVKGNSWDCNSTGDLLSEDITVPGPIVGAGLPGLIFACGGLLGLARHRRKRFAA